MSQKRTALILSAVTLGMLGLGFASKPLYDTFCRVTGFGGTTQIAEDNLTEIIERQVRVKFDSNIANDLPWEFIAQDKMLDVNLGASAMAYYMVKNTSDQPVTGIANFNVTPFKAGPYFVKTDCFCFEEQTLQPGETRPMPVIFFVDPEMDTDKRLDKVTEITLSYTFFEVSDPKAAPGPMGADPALD